MPAHEQRTATVERVGEMPFDLLERPVNERPDLRLGSKPLPTWNFVTAFVKRSTKST